ncbi:MAG: phosphoribosyl-AMP cyclohydrolase [Anaerolineales bacterium]|nr:phosphoribosyl-AMP cyclohydrolase [Anaerolineales bacterium]
MDLRFDHNGLITVVVQDAETGLVLMVAWANEIAIQQTLDTGFATFWSRSRKELWRKGSTSGNTMQITQIHVDCDADTLLYRVRPAGPACHTGNTTCFYRTLEEALAEETL